jgi:hypothetical protein
MNVITLTGIVSQVWWQRNCQPAEAKKNPHQYARVLMWVDAIPMKVSG